MLEYSDGDIIILCENPELAEQVARLRERLGRSRVEVRALPRAPGLRGGESAIASALYLARLFRPRRCAACRRCACRATSTHAPRCSLSSLIAWVSNSSRCDCRRRGGQGSRAGPAARRRIHAQAARELRYHRSRDFRRRPRMARRQHRSRAIPRALTRRHLCCRREPLWRRHEPTARSDSQQLSRLGAVVRTVDRGGASQFPGR